MTKLYLECQSGISGDMFVAALLDLGADEQVLRNVLKTVPADGFEIKISRVKKAGLDVCDFDVVLAHELDNHDHDMEYLYGHTHMHSTEHEKTSNAGHLHEHNHGHLHHHHTHRGLAEVKSIIDGTIMTDNARQIAKEIFMVLARAEAKAHGTTIDEVHFHEVGAIDSIVDIISAAVCIDDLGIKDVIIPFLAEGTGTVRCAHGILPVPVPAVCNIVAESGLMLQQTDVKGELVTPTGAAIAAAICTEKKLPEQYAIRKIGIGAGKREYERPSMVRAMLIETADCSDNIYKLETNIDDCTGENLGYVMDRLLKSGARDVNYMPVFMKKNRPAYQLNVICAPEDLQKMEDIIFSETTTIGIRRVKMDRTILKRRIQKIDTTLGEAVIKICTHNGRVKVYPEYDSVVDICNKTGLSFDEAIGIIQRQGYEMEASRSHDITTA